MFAVSRFAHYLKCMVRDKIGSTKEKEELQRWLQDWIYEYVDGDPVNSTEETKARKPLADARVDVFENEENPGLLLGALLSAPALPARRHGHRPEPGVAASRSAQRLRKFRAVMVRPTEPMAPTP